MAPELPADLTPDQFSEYVVEVAAARGWMSDLISDLALARQHAPLADLESWDPPWEIAFGIELDVEASGRRPRWVLRIDGAPVALKRTAAAFVLLGFMRHHASDVAPDEKVAALEPELAALVERLMLRAEGAATAAGKGPS